MYDWMKKIHMYAGLLSFMAFVVWGVTGIQAVFLPGPGEWQPPPISNQKEFPFEGAGNLDDKTLAKAVFQAAALAMVGGYYDVHRDDAGNLAFLAYSANGQRELTYLEKERRVRVVFRDSGLGDFLSNMHTGAEAHRNLLRVCGVTTTNSRPGLFSSWCCRGVTCGWRRGLECVGR